MFLRRAQAGCQESLNLTIVYVEPRTRHYLNSCLDAHNFLIRWGKTRAAAGVGYAD